MSNSESDVERDRYNRFLVVLVLLNCIIAVWIYASIRHGQGPLLNREEFLDIKQELREEMYQGMAAREDVYEIYMLYRQMTFLGHKMIDLGMVDEGEWAIIEAVQFAYDSNQLPLRDRDSIVTLLFLGDRTEGSLVTPSEALVLSFQRSDPDEERKLEELKSRIITAHPIEQNEQEPTGNRHPFDRN